MKQHLNQGNTAYVWLIILDTRLSNVYQTFDLIFKNTLVIHEGNTKEIGTMTVTLYLIKLIEY